MSAEKSIDPCIKTTLGPTFAIFGGSGKGSFLGRFPIGEKGANKLMYVRLGAAGGGKCAHDGSAAIRRRGPFWLGGPLGWPRARG